MLTVLIGLRHEPFQQSIDHARLRRWSWGGPLIMTAHDCPDHIVRNGPRKLRNSGRWHPQAVDGIGHFRSTP
jgi:hypothetical protein